MSGPGGWLPPSEAGERYVPPTAAVPVPPAPPVPPPAAFGAAPVRAPVPGELADWWPRVGAALLDYLIRLALVAPVVVLLGVLGVLGDNVGVPELVLVGFVGAPIGFIYATVLMARWNGQTVGHRVTHTRVVRLDGRPMDAGRAFVREGLVKYLLFEFAGGFTFGIATLLNYLWPLWDDRNQALHDKLANTVVVRA